MPFAGDEPGWERPVHQVLVYPRPAYLNPEIISEECPDSLDTHQGSHVLLDLHATPPSQPRVLPACTRAVSYVMPFERGASMHPSQRETGVRPHRLARARSNSAPMDLERDASGVDPLAPEPGLPDFDRHFGRELQGRLVAQAAVRADAIVVSRHSSMMLRA